MDPTRLVHVDDTDPRFIFRGDWTASQTTDPWGLSGPPFNQTLHESASDGTVIFRFKNAASIVLYGNINALNNRPKPSWRCALDSRVGNLSEPTNEMRSHYSFCKFPINDAGEHQLTMSITVPLGGIIAIDAIELTPASGVEVTEGEVLQVQDTDKAVTYYPSRNWITTSSGGTHDTSISGSSVQFNFTGSSVQFGSVYQPKDSGSATYTLDGGSPKNISIPASIPTTYNNILFSEDGLSPTNHSLNVTFTGGRNQTPLSLGYFYVTLPSGLSPMISEAEIIDPFSESTQKKPVGAIVGGVIGGIAGLAIIVTAAFFLWRYYRRRREDEGINAMLTVTPFEPEPKQPEPIPPPMGTTVIHSQSPSSSVTGGKAASNQVVLSFDDGRGRPARDYVHTDSGYRDTNPSTSRLEDGVEIREIPPVYSPT